MCDGRAPPSWPTVGAGNSLLDLLLPLTLGDAARRCHQPIADVGCPTDSHHPARSLLMLRSALAFFSILMGLRAGAQTPPRPAEGDAARRVRLVPCVIEGLAVDAKCGWFSVPENRKAQRGRT